jgi:NAD(P)-dependent dehydrogenase (short-subunit alcohol dehydrogenase family)
MKLQGRSALVIGGAAGLGRAAVEACAQDGAQVMIADVNEAGGAALVAALKAEGREAQFVRCDVADEASTKAAVDATVKAFGKLDILVNSAGYRDPGAPGDWHFIVDLHLKGPYYACRHALPEMEKAGGGAIVNVASISGVTGGVATTADETGYACSKHAVVGLSRTLALAYAKKNIRVNAVCPGYIKTAGTQALYEAPDGGRKLISETLRVPMDRWGEPHEIGKVVAFLVSDDASFITGQPIIVDGGFMAR